MPLNADSMSSAQLHLSDRRRFSRFVARVRVAYDAGGGWTISSTDDLSQGGMLLAAAVGLWPGARATFLLHLQDGEKPQPALGEVIGLAGAGARVRFDAPEDELRERIRRWAELVVVPDLEATLSEAVRDRSRLVQLASLYHELGRDSQAADLYHAALDLGAQSRELLERVAPAIVQQAPLLGARGLQLLRDLRGPVKSALSVAPSPVLEAVATALDQAAGALDAGARAERVAPLAAEQIAQLRDSIRKNREALYRGFLQLLEERNRLRQLEGSVPSDSERQAAQSAAGDLEPLLRSIRAQLDTMHGAAAPAAARPAARADSPAEVTVLSHRGGVATSPARSPAQVEIAPVPPRGRALVIGLAAAFALLTAVGVGLYVTRPAPGLVDRAPGATGRVDGGSARPGVARHDGAEPSARALDPHLDDALRLLRQRKALLAVDAARDSLADAPGNPEAYRILGVAYGMLGRENESLDAFEQFVRLAPGDPATPEVRELLREHHRTPAP